MSEYTPTTEEIEDTYAGTWINCHNHLGRKAFRRWLAAEIAAAKAEAWDEANHTIAGWSGALLPDSANPYRADRIEATDA